MKKLNNIFALFLVTVVAFTISGPMLVFKAQQQQVRHEIKQKIKAGVPDSDLHLIKIPHELEKTRNSIFKKIHSKEFRYQGKMYDIVRFEQYTDETWYYCIADEEEEELFAQLDELVTKEMNGKKKLQVPTNILNLYYGSIEVFELPALSKKSLAIGYSFGIKTWSNPPLLEPPKA